MAYFGNALHALTFRKAALEKLRKQPEEGLVAFLGLSGLLTTLYLPAIALIVNLRSIFGGGGPLVEVLPTNLALLLVVLFIIFFTATAGIGLLFVCMLHLFSGIFGTRTKFRELLAAWSPALVPLCIMLVPLFTVLIFGFLGGMMSDAVGTAIGVVFHILLVSMSILSLVYTALLLRTKLNWGATAAVLSISLLLTGMVGSGIFFTFAWLI